MEIEITLPQDLVNEILLHLPLKSLARFKCVSRQWEALISHRRFTKTLLERYPKPNSTLLWLLRKDNGGRIYPRRQNGEVSLIESYKPRFVPLTLRLEGTYHGLICFSNYITGDACVWNPLTNQWRTIDFQSKIFHFYGAFFGFGFDCINDDYKVVRIRQTYHKPHAYDLMIEICKLKSNEPGVIVLPSVEVPFKLCNVTPVTVNGSSHWIAFHPKNKYFQIVRFDMVHEKFLEIPFSNDMPNVNCGYYVNFDTETLATDGQNIDGQKFFLGIFKGSICVFVSDSLNRRVEAWSMNCKNHDLSDLVWTRIFKVQLNCGIDAVFGFTTDDKIVVGSINFGYYFYDPWKEQYVYPPRHYRLQIRQALPYVESLVSVWPQ